MKKIILGLSLFAFVAGTSVAVFAQTANATSITQNDGDPKKKKEKKGDKKKGDKMEKKSCSPKSGKACCSHGASSSKPAPKKEL